MYESYTLDCSSQSNQNVAGIIIWGYCRIFHRQSQGNWRQTRWKSGKSGSDPMPL